MKNTKKTGAHGLSCPEYWVDPEILPLVTLLNRLGFETVWSCAGIGPARTGVEFPPSSMPPGERQWVRKEGGVYYSDKPHHSKESIPYIVFKTPDLMPDWATEVLRYLKKMTVGHSESSVSEISRAKDMLIFDVQPKKDGEICITFDPDLFGYVLGSREIVTAEFKRMWIHELIKAFSFI